MGVDDGSLWEVQWHPASGRPFRRFVLTRRGLRRLAVVLGGIALVSLLILALMPIGLQSVFTRLTLVEAERENRSLKREGEQLREQVLTASHALDVRLVRARRLAWTFGCPAAVWRGKVAVRPGLDGRDELLVAWAEHWSQRLVAIGEEVVRAADKPRIPFRALPLTVPITAGRAVPVALFGWRNSPFTGKTVANHGVTIAAHLGELVVAPGDGVVVFAGTPRERRANEWTRLGNLVVIDHGGGISTVFGHLQDVLVRRGEAVRRWQSVATVGQSGWTRVPAVYYEVRWPLGVGESKPIDPALVTVDLPVEDLESRLADPTGGLPEDFAQIPHLQGGGAARAVLPLVRRSS